MRILLTSDPEIPVPPLLYGGVQRLVDSLLHNLKSRGHKVGLVAHPESTSPADYFLPWQGQESQGILNTFRNTATLRRAIKTFQPDIIHSFSRLAYLLPCLSSSLPKIMSYGRVPSYYTTHWATKLASESLVFAACSNYIRDIGQQSGGNWTTIYNWVDIEKYTFQPKVCSDAPLVFLSRVERIKGAHTAIEIAKRSNKKLIIAGNYIETGESGKYWHEEVKPQIDGENIQYIGPVNDQQKDELLGQALAMVVPIEWDEPFGIVFAEALACGTPVISCPRGALPEIVRQGIDGFLINDIEEGCQAVEDISRLDRLNCRNRVEDCFSADAIISQYEQLYRKLCSQLVG